MKKAFTLAEILITMGIVGVVSAMTIPALNQSWQKQAYVTQLRKVYSEVAQAAVRLKTDRNVQSLAEARVTSNNIREEFIHKYFVVLKDCPIILGCFANSYKNVNGTNIVTSVNSFDTCSSSVIASGAALCYRVQNNRIRIIVDVNGTKDPNIFGRDVFAMEVLPNGKVRDIDNGSVFQPNATTIRQTHALGQIIKDGWKMTY